MSEATAQTTSPAAASAAAVPAVPRSGWHVATVASTRRETPNASRIELEVDGWPGNAAGQHLDVRLTAPDGYTATRSYSIASSGAGTRVTLAVDRLPDGEVSPYLVDDVRAGDMLEVHGPLGAFFVWAPDAAHAAAAVDARPVQLIAGGSGVVPLYAMAEAHGVAQDPTRFRLLYSVRSPDDVYFADELRRLAEASAPLQLDLVYTRRAPDGWRTPPARITREVLESAVIPAAERPRVFVCGSTGFVERVADWLVELGHDARSIRTERYGGT
ncbi:ferredoxin-NADP reductase [Agromyces hippuratus]|uniref:Ferredoxin-NADP reductase n=1 Tax=Agromyces hippuratus TaxID=286438 RepID=A0A852X5L6_9MICO|nr:ferredoxin reductase [Agromyces hippuratus]NYG21311.1 ferredoxin-NADP reductase [Agromyces hippuratus]